MKLLFDENLSHRLVGALADVFPGSQHVRDLALQSASDRLVVQMAGLLDLVLVTKDHDFDDLVILEPDAGPVLRLDLGNCTTAEVEHALRSAAPALPGHFADNRLVALPRR